ncbi:MAG: hypothetical protein BM557_01440 [Flavobacterium sp. MedPE-SWcel]|uniref:DUF1579 domain-containing protein n=1 Tax=uncultured Flavobacterium sp. TaxID=165435 RepID=UPI00091DF8A2|nr:DUF1579 domain-containing protein [uncultured Flavobacterium sp.]OIQ22068.1 MAG: hypothetical protein BM557_01440 [Flavobacterium sp. MedPE-SWcel]
MKKICLSLAVIALAFTSCKKEEKVEHETEAGTEVMNDTIDHEEVMPEEPMDSIAMQEAWMEHMTPSDMHKMLAEETGEWNNEMSFWMAPGAPEQNMESTCAIKMILGGRYQETKYSGDMDGMPFEGMATVAYDNASKKFTSTWIDNMGTGMLVMTGTHDADSNTMNFTGEMVDGMTKKTRAVREVYTIVDENTRKMEMFYDSGENEYKSMEITMRRK